MSSVTVEVQDPLTGRKRRIAMIFHDGKFYLQEIKNTDRATASAARLEADAQFALAATKAFGLKKTGELPPAAEFVRSARFGTTESRKGLPKRRERRQQQLRDLVGETNLSRMYDLLRLELSVGRGFPAPRTGSDQG